MDSSRDKRVYSRPFTKEETSTFIEIVQKFKNIIENKYTDGTTSAEKNRAWDQIANEFNLRNDSHLRTANSLRTKWQSVKRQTRNTSADILREKWASMKKNAKTAEVARCKYIYGTGSGPPGKPLDPTYEKILEIVDKTSIEGSRGCPDSEYGKSTDTLVSHQIPIIKLKEIENYSFISFFKFIIF